MTKLPNNKNCSNCINFRACNLHFNVKENNNKCIYNINYFEEKEDK